MIICFKCGFIMDEEDYGYKFCPICKKLTYFNKLSFK